MKAKRKNSNGNSVLCLLLAFCLILSLWGCAGQTGQAGNLMTGIQAKSADSDADLDGPGAAAVADFGLRTLRQCLEEEPGNTMISPLSILCALGMTANGAQGETLSQMEEVFGLPLGELREYLTAYVKAMPSSEDASFHAANSLWLKDQGLSVEQDFLQANADYFGADAYKVPFDSGTLEQINGWVKENTHGMIPKILEELNPATVAVLVNALAFEGKWDEPYEDIQVHDGVFTKEDGTSQSVEMMHSSESWYLEDETAVGFLKYYKGRDYAFAALLPEEGVPVQEYLSSLSGEKLCDLLENAQVTEVSAGIPKFTSDYSASLNDLLMDMGMTDAFDPALADFSGLGTMENGDNIYVSQVLHKTHIAVDEQGTKAGAVTAVQIEASGAIMEEPKRVILDRPFLYMIIDCRANVPIFLGTVSEI